MDLISWKWKKKTKKLTWCQTATTHPIPSLIRGRTFVMFFEIFDELTIFYLFLSIIYFYVFQMSVAGVSSGGGQSNFQQMNSARGHNQQQQQQQQMNSARGHQQQQQNIHVGGGAISQMGQAPQQQQSVGSMFPGHHHPTFAAQSQGGLQGPLAYLEKTTTNIGMPDQKR